VVGCPLPLSLSRLLCPGALSVRHLVWCVVWQVEDILISINGMDMRNISGVLSLFFMFMCVCVHVCVCACVCVCMCVCVHVCGVLSLFFNH
jgi:hypothetical protein